MSDDLFPADDRLPRLSLDPRPHEQDFEESAKRKSPGEDMSDRRYIRGPGWLAWLVVIALALFIIVNQVIMNFMMEPTGLTPGDFLQPVTDGKQALGLRELSQRYKVSEFEEQIPAFAERVNGGPIEQRLCYTILANELEGPDAAQKAVDELERLTKRKGVELDEDQQRLKSILSQIYGDLARGRWPPNISQDDRQFLGEQLPWYGELAMQPDTGQLNESRDQLLERTELTTLLSLFMVLAILAGLVLGLVALVIFLIQFFRGALRSRVTDDSMYGPVYIETFAIWFVLFLGLQLLAAANPFTRGTAFIALGMLLPLSALVWPVLRGVPVGHMLQDIGLQLKNPFVEVAAGIAAWFAMIPVVLLALLVSLVLLFIQGMLTVPGEFDPGGVGHPIANEAFSGDMLPVLIKLLFIASVLAPLTEEIMFRGVLYRHLRDSSRHMARWGSVGFATLLSSILFAAIHPQGIIGIPVLTTLAIGFCLAREWRGSLVAPITMHALNNGVTMLFLVPAIV
ncbi:MAG: CPBP family intramembrane glutamic endopeptidase [Pirellulaceae bacterium]